MFPIVSCCMFVAASMLDYSIAVSDLSMEKNVIEGRPIWSQWVNHSWQCGHNFRDSVSCSDDKKTLRISRCYCVYYDEKVNQTQLGYCLTTCFNMARLNYIVLSRYSVDNGSQFNDYMCSKDVASYTSNRGGRFCGRCNEGYGLSLYTQQLYKCIPCKDQSAFKNVLKYLVINIAPLALFFFIFVVAKIAITNSKLNGIVFYVQILFSHTLWQMNLNAWFDTGYLSSRDIYGIKLFQIYFNFVNLNLFQDFYPSICLGPHFNALHIVALDYCIGLSPFIFIVLSYLLITLHDKNVTLIVLAWKPFKYCIRFLHADMGPQTSLVEVFASFILLSSVRILATSLTLLSYINVFDELGNQLDRQYLYLDANIEFFGSEHLPFALLALAVSFLFVILPFLLQLVYPCMCFQKMLNNRGWNSHSLRIFMDAFQGCYKTEPWDMRYFSVIYLFARILLLFLGSLTHFYLELIVCNILVFVLLGIITVLVQPYRVSSHNYLDTATCLISTLPCITIIFMDVVIYFDHRIEEAVTPMNTLALSITGFYWTAIFGWGLLGDKFKVIFHKVWSKIWAQLHRTSTDANQCQEFVNEREHVDESTQLLQSLQ